jgi:phosphoglycerol transferase MdoB-like AlkP superfamily enzyme
MPGGLDYFILGSVFFLCLSFVVSLLIVGIVAIIKKDEKTFRYYLILWLKIFGIMFVSLDLLAFIVLVAI